MHNAIGFNVLEKPQVGAQRAAVFICGDDAVAKAAVMQLAASLNLDAIDAGALNVARYLEPLALLWVGLAFRQGMGWEIAFALLRR